MESDRAKLEKLLTEFGVGFIRAVNSNSIVCRESGEKVHGYGGFFIEFEFTESGEFIQIGIWE